MHSYYPADMKKICTQTERIIKKLGGICNTRKRSAPNGSCEWEPPGRACLLFPEGQAIGALIHGGIALVGADLDLLQRAEIGVAAMVNALGHGAADTLIRMTAHRSIPPFLISLLVCGMDAGLILERGFHFLVAKDG